MKFYKYVPETSTIVLMGRILNSFSDHMLEYDDKYTLAASDKTEPDNNVPMNFELRLSVEDFPNFAGIVIDAVLCTKLALNRSENGVLYPPAAYFMKHLPKQFNDDETYQMT